MPTTASPATRTTAPWRFGMFSACWAFILSGEGQVNAYRKLGILGGESARLNNTMLDINIDKSMIEMVFGKVVAFAKQQGVAIPDYLMPNEWNEPQTQSYEQFREYLYDLYASIPEGVTETYLHPAKESDDLKGTSSVWERRVWEYRVMSDPATKQHIEAHGIKLINYRDLAAMRKA